MTARRVLVKICGLTRPADCLAVNRAGADFAGFVFAPSRRQVTRESAQLLIKLLEAAIQPVGIFVSESDEQICETARLARLQVIQLHHAAIPGRIDRLRRLLPHGTAVWQYLAVPLDGSAESALSDAVAMLEQFKALPDNASRPDFPDAWLLDSCRPSQPGGTGQTFDWQVFQAFCRIHPTILAGGLNNANIRSALNLLQPAAVDCSSGVETDGLKDPVKISLFCNLVRAFNNRAGLTERPNLIGGTRHG